MVSGRLWIRAASGAAGGQQRREVSGECAGKGLLLCAGSTWCWKTFLSEGCTGLL